MRVSRMSTFWAALAAFALPMVAPGCASEAAEPETPSEDSDLVGGTSEARFAAVGYLATADNTKRPLCGATLISDNVIVTAAHCAYRSRDARLVFGVGELGGRTVRVQEVVYHPNAHLEKQGRIDLVHSLLLYDVAYLILEDRLRDVAPMALYDKKPTPFSGVRLVGYGADKSDRLIRKGVDGQVILNAKLGADTIVEVRPRSGGAVCHRDGDEGHPALAVDASGKAALLGVYVGSVTQSFTDCRKYLQLLNGYESSHGYLDFYREGIARGAQR